MLVSSMTVEATMRPIDLAIILARSKVAVIPIRWHLRPLMKCKANEPEEGGWTDKWHKPVRHILVFQ